MTRAAIEGKLREVTGRLRRARDELRVLDEQLLALRETADETRLQAIVDESPLSRAESTDAERHVAATSRSRDRLATTVAELERARDDLLDRLVLESR